MFNRSISQHAPTRHHPPDFSGGGVGAWFQIMQVFLRYRNHFFGDERLEFYRSIRAS
jgi:hypothetical protein